MNLGKPSEQSLSTSCSSQTNPPAIRGIRFTLEQTVLRAAIDQFDNRVVLEPEGFGSIGNRRRTPRGDARNRQQELVLLRMQTRLDGGTLTDLKEIAQLMAKGRKRLVEKVIWILRCRAFVHNDILSYYDIFP